MGNSTQASKVNEMKKSTKIRTKRNQKRANATDETGLSVTENDTADFDDDEDDDQDEGDDSQSFHISSSKSNEDYIMSKTNYPQSSSSMSQQSNSSLKLKQITKMISPKWPNRVFAFELIRRIITLCDLGQANITSENAADNSELTAEVKSENYLKKTAHFDLKLAKKLKSQFNQHQPKNSQEENYLILFLQDLMRIACIGATSSCDPLKLVGLDLLNDLILAFAHVEEPNAEFKGHLVLEQYQVSIRQKNLNKQIF